MRAWLGMVVVGLLLAPAQSRAEVVKYALIAGNDRGHAREVELLYAHRDAQRLSDVLQHLGGFSAENVIVLLGKTADDLQKALITLNDRIRRELQDGTREVLLFVYYSGHADSDSLHLGRSDLPIRQLRQLVRGSAATFRVLVLDACKSGSLTRVKGGRFREPFEISIQGVLGTEGTVFITSSAADEDSQESDQLSASFFSHFFHSGLLGAADTSGDGRVSLAEVYAYAHEQTIKASSQTWAGAQHPTFQYDIKGKGDVILTDLSLNAPDKAALVFPAGGSFLVMKTNAAGPVVAEIESQDAQRKVVLPPGTYFIRERREFELREGVISMIGQSEHMVDTSSFERIAYARLVRKGNEKKQLAHGPALFYRLRGEVLDGMGPMHTLGIAYPLTFEWFTLEPRLAIGRSRASNDILTSETWETDLLLAATHAVDWSDWTFSAGIELGLTVLNQRFTTIGVAPDRDSVGFVFGGLTTLAVEVFDGFYLQASAELITYALQQGQFSNRGDVITPLTWALGLGVGKNF